MKRSNIKNSLWLFCVSFLLSGCIFKSEFGFLSSLNLQLEISSPMRGTAVDTGSMVVTGVCTYHSDMGDVVLTGDIDATVTTACLPSGSGSSDRGMFSATVSVTGLPVGGDREIFATQMNVVTSETVSDDAVYVTNVTYRSMVTVWRIDNPGDQVTLPVNTGRAFNIDVDWGDGSPIQTYTTGSVPVHTYASAGEMTVTITGTLRGWSAWMIDQTTRDRLLRVEELGTLGWESFEGAFEKCFNLTTVSGGDTSSVINMAHMFYDAQNAVPDTSGWNTENVENMRVMFNNATLANPDTSRWDTSKVTDMAGMFFRASNANPDTSNWNTALVRDMNDMFHEAFNAEPITTTSGDIWNTSRVEDMKTMFYRAHKANPDTSGWDTSQVRNMHGMFMDALVAEPVTTTQGNIWNTSNVEDMAKMFQSAPLANPDTSGWDTSKVRDMDAMFFNAPEAQPDTSNWDTANVENMQNMFFDARKANPVTTTNGNIWNTSKVRTMQQMFYGARVANPDTSGWDTSNVENMGGMFQGAWAAAPDTSTWNTAKVVSMDRMFMEAYNAEPVTVTNMATGVWDTSNVENMDGMFFLASIARPITSGWKTSRVTNMARMFFQAVNATPDTSNWDMSNVEDIEAMFFGATVAVPHVSNWNLSSLDSNIMGTFHDSGFTPALYSEFLIRLAATTTATNLVLQVDLNFQAHAQVARQYLLNDLGWTISDRGLE